MTIPGAALAETVLGYGSTTGRDTEKVQRFGSPKQRIELTEIEGSPIRVPVNSRAAIQCTSGSITGWGTIAFCICQAEQVYASGAEEALFAWNRYGKNRPGKAGLIRDDMKSRKGAI